MAKRITSKTAIRFAIVEGARAQGLPVPQRVSTAIYAFVETAAQDAVAKVLSELKPNRTAVRPVNDMTHLDNLIERSKLRLRKQAQKLKEQRK